MPGSSAPSKCAGFPRLVSYMVQEGLGLNAAIRERLEDGL
jgi:hypothetical protein